MQVSVSSCSIRSSLPYIRSRSIGLGPSRSPAVFVVSFALFLAGRFGGGDVKLLTASALWAGPSLIISMLVVMAVTGGALAVLVWAVQLLRRYRPASYGDVSLTTAAYAVPNRLPYGVAIAAGAGVIGLSMASG